MLCFSYVGIAVKTRLTNNKRKKIEVEKNADKR